MRRAVNFNPSKPVTSSQETTVMGNCQCSSIGCHFRVFPIDGTPSKDNSVLIETKDYAGTCMGMPHHLQAFCGQSSSLQILRSIPKYQSSMVAFECPG